MRLESNKRASMIHETTGDILKANVEALVNPVNTYGVMGAGLALQFKQSYPVMADAYSKLCHQRQVRLGEVSVWGTGTVAYPHYIINFPTKNHWTQPSRLEYIERGLCDLKQKVMQLAILSIAIPQLGCGLGGLNWDNMRPLIYALDWPACTRIYLYSSGR
jgi:O-acetyl-ADP-ribose deacetylase (regulator of RNase III)